MEFKKSSWFTMFRKDLRMTRTGVLAEMIVTVVLGSLLLYLATTSQPAAIFSSVIGGAWLVKNVLYLPVYLWYTFSREWRRSAPLWLHVPQSGWRLLSSKLVSGLLSQLVSTLLIIALDLWILHLDVLYVIQRDAGVFTASGAQTVAAVQASIFWVALGVFLLSLDLGLWVMLISISMQAVKNSWRKLRWLLGLAILLIPTWLLVLFESSRVYHALFTWGPVHIPFPLTGLGFPHRLTINSGDIGFEVLCMVIVFALSGWLLDRKTEV